MSDPVLVVTGTGTGVGKTVVTAAALRAPVLVVAAAGLGTLNHTALTCEAIAARGIISEGVVIGSWPRAPGLTELANLADLEVIAGQPLAGRLPEGSGRLGRSEFRAVALAGLGPRLGGRLNSRAGGWPGGRGPGHAG